MYMYIYIYMCVLYRAIPSKIKDNSHSVSLWHYAFFLCVWKMLVNTTNHGKKCTNYLRSKLIIHNTNTRYNSNIYMLLSVIQPSILNELVNFSVFHIELFWLIVFPFFIIQGIC